MYCDDTVFKMQNLEEFFKSSYGNLMVIL